MEPNAAANLMGRYFGLTLLGLGVAPWFLRGSRPTGNARTVVRIGSSSCRGPVRFHVGNGQRHNERDGLVSRSDLCGPTGGVSVLSVLGSDDGQRQSLSTLVNLKIMRWRPARKSEGVIRRAILTP